MSVAPAIRNPHARALQGSRAGIVSRVLADGIDWLIAIAIYLGILVGYAVAAYLLTASSFVIPDPPVWFTVFVPWLILVIYLDIGWSSTGRTIGKSVVGLRVVTRTGARLPARRAFGRAVLCASLPWVLLWVLVSRRNDGLHDIVFRSAVVYDWLGRG